MESWSEGKPHGDRNSYGLLSYLVDVKYANKSYRRKETIIQRLQHWRRFEQMNGYTIDQVCQHSVEEPCTAVIIITKRYADLFLFFTVGGFLRQIRMRESVG